MEPHFEIVGGLNGNGYSLSDPLGCIFTRVPVQEVGEDLPHTSVIEETIIFAHEGLSSAADKLHELGPRLVGDRRLQPTVQMVLRRPGRVGDEQVQPKGSWPQCSTSLAEPSAALLLIVFRVGIQLAEFDPLCRASSSCCRSKSFVKDTRQLCLPALHDSLLAAMR